MQSKTKRVAILGTALAATATLGGVGVLASANAAQTDERAAAADVTTVRGELHALNNSGASGRAEVKLEGEKAHVKVHAHGLAPNLPHAQHIHFGQQARNECPSVADDSNVDQRLNTVEGIPAYGPVRKSLTTSGDTSPKSTLAVDRFPTAPDGKVHYKRIVPMQGEALAQAIRDGKGVVVIHGVDYNNNGTYDFNAGKSDLDKSLPAEATDPAVCGVLMN